MVEEGSDAQSHARSSRSRFSQAPRFDFIYPQTGALSVARIYNAPRRALGVPVPRSRGLCYNSFVLGGRQSRTFCARAGSTQKNELARETGSLPNIAWRSALTCARAWAPFGANNNQRSSLSSGVKAALRRRAKRGTQADASPS